MTTAVDITIVGGGPVGNTLALALERLSIPIALIEEKSPELQQLNNEESAKKTRFCSKTSIFGRIEALDEASSGVYRGVNEQRSEFNNEESAKKATFCDGRAIVLTWGSTQIFRNCQLWQQLLPYATPLQGVHVSKRGGFGLTTFSAEKLDVPALGYVVEMSALMSVLVTANLQSHYCQRIAPARVIAIDRQQEGWQVSYERQGKIEQLKTKLLIAADGVNSTVRQLLNQEFNIKTKINDYHEHAIVANIALANEHHHIAYERFTNEGPVAMLPRAGRQVTAVWTLPTEKAHVILQEDKYVLLQSLQAMFGYRLGRFLDISKPVTFPLRQVIMLQQVFPGLVFLGNAAHSLHPIAAQGFNLGLRDIMTLVDCLSVAQQQGFAINDFSILKNYMEKRQFDQKFMMTFTHSLTQIFTTKMPGASLFSNAGMVLLNKMLPLKKLLARTVMGLKN